MRSGDIDGKDIVYSHDGRLMLGSGESLVRVVSNVNGCVLPKWGRFVNGRAVIDTVSGKGDWWITDKRMVFIRRPNSKGVKRWRTTPLEVADGVHEILRIRRVLHEGGYDYCEIKYDEVRFYKKHRKGAGILVMVSGEKYQVLVNDDVFAAVLPCLMRCGIEPR